jgi:DNA-directed RNA polymerase II subunit RPB3
MTYFKNKEITKDNIKFELTNVNTGLANGIRRVLIADIETIAFNETNINMKENNTILHNEYIKHRISLIPIYFNEIKNYNDDEPLIINYSKKNNDENFVTVYAQDCTIEYKDKLLNSKDIFIRNVPICELRNGETLIFNAKAIKGRSKMNAIWQSVNNIGYYFKYEQPTEERLSEFKTEIEKKNYINCDIQKDYIKNDEGEPETYVFNVELCGNRDGTNLISETLDFLRIKIIKIIDCIENYDENNEKININENNKVKGLTDYYIKDEDHTIGNLINYELNNDDRIIFCGYNMKHPLTPEIRIRIRVKKKFIVKDILIENLNNIKMKIDYLKMDWEKNI